MKTINAITASQIKCKLRLCGDLQIFR